MLSRTAAKITAGVATACVGLTTVYAINDNVVNFAILEDNSSTAAAACPGPPPCMIIEDPGLDDHSRWPITINNDMAAHSDVFEEVVSDHVSHANDVAPFEMGAAEFGMWLVWLGAAALSLALFAAKVAVVAAAAYTTFAVVPQAVMDAGTRANVMGAISDLAQFYGALFDYIARGKSYPTAHFAGNRQAQCQVYSLALVYRMWSLPHYRNGDFREDMLKNLRNVAIPGTGIPLSVVCHFKCVAVVFLLVGYPLAAIVSALNLHRGSVAKVATKFSEQLLCPQDWFSFWQLNCRLATHHSSVTGESDYGMEDKLDFLECAEANGIPVTPWMKTPKLIVKHRNEEGGLGFHAFDNCTDGGNWIIQEALDNDEFVSSLLPERAPLSTFRVISASRGGLSTVEKGAKGSVKALSCVFRAGREGAVTDHVNVLYDVDMKSGVIGEGTTNQHWYQLGLRAPFTTPWTTAASTRTHPDTGRVVTGTKVAEMTEMLELVERAHARMMPGVPLAGWDVAFTNKGMLLLEANLSCNFFRGSFDKAAYFDFVHEYFTDLR